MWTLSKDKIKLNKTRFDTPQDFQLLQSGKQKSGYGTKFNPKIINRYSYNRCVSKRTEIRWKLPGTSLRKKKVSHWINALSFIDKCERFAFKATSWRSCVSLKPADVSGISPKIGFKLIRSWSKKWFYVRPLRDD